MAQYLPYLLQGGEGLEGGQPVGSTCLQTLGRASGNGGVNQVAGDDDARLNQRSANAAQMPTMP